MILLFLDFYKGESIVETDTVWFELFKAFLAGLTIVLGIWLEKTIERRKEKKDRLVNLLLFNKTIKTMLIELNTIIKKVDEVILSLKEFPLDDTYSQPSLDTKSLNIINNLASPDLYYGYVTLYKDFDKAIDDFSMMTHQLKYLNKAIETTENKYHKFFLELFDLRIQHNNEFEKLWRYCETIKSVYQNSTSKRQKEVYDIVLEAQKAFREIVDSGDKTISFPQKISMYLLTPLGEKLESFRDYELVDNIYYEIGGISLTHSGWLTKSVELSERYSSVSIRLGMTERVILGLSKNLDKNIRRHR